MFSNDQTREVFLNHEHKSSDVCFVTSGREKSKRLTLNAMLRRVALSTLLIAACDAFLPSLVPCSRPTCSRSSVHPYLSNNAPYAQDCGVVAQIRAGRRASAALRMDTSLSRVDELNKAAWEARLASLEQHAVSNFQNALKEFSANVRFCFVCMCLCV